MKTRVIAEERLERMPEEIRITAPATPKSLVTDTEVFRPTRGTADTLWVKLPDGWYYFTNGTRG